MAPGVDATRDGCQQGLKFWTGPFSSPTGKVGAWITTIPEAVLGGMTTFLFANGEGEMKGRDPLREMKGTSEGGTFAT